jgi:hypothetical protein
MLLIVQLKIYGSCTGFDPAHERTKQLLQKHKMLFYAAVWNSNRRWQKGNANRATKPLRKYTTGFIWDWS